MTYKKFFALSLEKGIEQIQITENTTESSQIKLINNRIDDYNDTYTICYNIKAQYNGKTVTASTELLDESIVDLLIFKAKETQSIYQDDYLDKKIIKIKKRKIEIDISEEIKKLKDLYYLATNHKEINNISMFFCQMYSKKRIINNKGLDISTDSMNYEFYINASAKKDGKVVSYDKSLLKSKKEEINFEKITENVIDKVLILLNQKLLETKKYNIIIDSSVANYITSHIASMLSAKNNRQKMSFLSDKLNKKVFSDKLTILEEPLNINFPGYSNFDNEGNKTYNKVLIEKGKIVQYLYNNSEAKIDNVSSTANGYTSITTRNMYIKPGDCSIEDLLKKLNNGLYIVDCMGAQGTAVNQSTGNISIQVFGFIVKKGKITNGFYPAILSTTFEELLSNIEEIGNDLEFYSKQSGCPSLYIKDISLAAQ